MFAVSDKIQKGIQIGRVFSQGPRGHLAVQDLNRDICVISRHLPPALAAVVGGDTHKSYVLGGKSLN